jgi:hypothetical protein
MVHVCTKLIHDISRWLRLLFTREFNMQDSMVMWDGLLACDPEYNLAEWICVAMLLRIRNQCEYVSSVLRTFLTHDWQ